MPGIGDILSALGKALPYAYKPYRDLKMAEFSQMGEMARQAKAEEQKWQKQQGLEILQKESEAGNVEAVDAFGGQYGEDIQKILRSQAQRIQEDKVAAFVQQVQGRLVGSEDSGEFIPSVSPQGETLGLVTPTGATVAAGQPGIMPPVRKPSGAYEEKLKVSEKGEVSREYVPTPAAKLKLYGENAYRQTANQIERDLLAQGVDPAMARAQASNLARHAPGAIPTAAGEEQAGLAGAAGPEGLSSKGLEQSIQKIGARAGEMATSRDLDRADRVEFNNAQAALYNLARLQKLYGQIKDKAGPAAGRYARIKDWAGVGSPEVREFIQTRRAIKDALRRRVTGAAAPFAELGQIESRIPSINDNPDLFEASLSASVNDINATLEGVSKTLKAQRFLVPGELTEVPEELSKHLDTMKDQATPVKPSKSDEDWARQYLEGVKGGQ